MPFYINYLSIKLMFILPRELNGCKNDQIISKLTTLKNIEFIPDINLDDIKRRATELTTDRLRVTINDILMTVLSKSIKDYFV